MNARLSTSELKLRHRQCVEYLDRHSGAVVGGGVNVRLGAMPWESKEDNEDVKEEMAARVEEKEAIERELLRRWQAGDKKAFLPGFE